MALQAVYSLSTYSTRKFKWQEMNINDSRKLAKRNKRASLVRKDIRKARNLSTLDIILSAANGPVLKCLSTGVIDGIANYLWPNAAKMDELSV